MPARARARGWPAALLVCLVAVGCKDDVDPGTPTVAAARDGVGTPPASGQDDEAKQAGDSGPAHEDTAAPAGLTSENLERFIPEEIRGVRRQIVSGGEREGFVAAAYEIVDDRGRRFININLQKVQDLQFEEAQFRVSDGEERQVQGSALLGRKIDGRLVQRSYSHSTESSEVTVLVDDAISVRVMVEKAKDPDEPFEILSLIDLDGLASIVP
jgi:hypothetical protein